MSLRDGDTTLKRDTSIRTSDIMKAAEVIPFETFCGDCGGYIDDESKIARWIESVETNPTTGESEHTSYPRCLECQRKRDTFMEQGVIGARIRHDQMKKEEQNARRTYGHH